MKPKAPCLFDTLIVESVFVHQAVYYHFLLDEGGIELGQSNIVDKLEFFKIKNNIRNQLLPSLSCLFTFSKY